MACSTEGLGSRASDFAFRIEALRIIQGFCRGYGDIM